MLAPFHPSFTERSLLILRVVSFENGYWPVISGGGYETGSDMI